MNSENDQPEASARPEQPIDQVPVLATVRRAYAFVAANIVPLALCLVQLAIVSIIPTQILQKLLSPLFFSVASSIWSALVFAPFAVLVHRAIVLDEPMQATGYFPAFADERVKTFIGMGLLLYVLPQQLMTASAWIGASAPVIAAMLSLTYFGIVIYMLRFALVFPAIAVDKFSSLDQSHKLLAGSIVRVFAATLLASLPYIILLIALGPSLITESGEPTVWLLLLGLLIAPVFPAVLSYAYIAKRDAPHRHDAAQNLGPDTSNASEDSQH